MDSTQLAHVDDSEDYGFDLMLDNQLYSLSSFLPTQTSEITAALADSFPNPSMSEFIVLLQALEVQFINGGSSQFRLFPRLLGRGGFSDIKYEQISSPASGRAVAIKELKPESTNQDHMASVSNLPTNALAQAFIEVCIMKHPDLSRHRNIVQLIGITDNATMMPLTGLGPLCLVMEYSHFGSLEFYTRSHPKEIDFDTKVKLIDDITSGLQALHSCDVVHNDLKASNVLLFSEGPDRRLTAKLSDFGCSFVLASYKTIKGSGATLLYAAPEAYVSTCLVKPSRDMYSLGLMIMEIMLEERPFAGIQSDRLWEFKCSKEMPEYIVDQLQSVSAPSHVLELVKKLLIADPNERLSDTNTVLRDLRQGDVNSMVLSDYPSEIDER